MFLAAAIAFMLTGCGFFSKNNTTEYSDGSYKCEVNLEGGSGRATITSPADVNIENGEKYLTVEWSSPNYDYMLKDAVRFENIASVGDNSRFVIPFDHFDESFEVVGDTTAMSTPHEVDYVITVSSPGVNKSNEDKTQTKVGTTRVIKPDLSKLKHTKSMELSYATQFCVDYYEYKDYKCSVITIGSDQSAQYFMLGDEECFKQVSGSIAFLPAVDNTYLVSTSVMDLIVEIDALENIRLSGSDINNWYIDEAKTALRDKKMLFAGKYSLPNYELLLEENCNLAIENTMIYHNPEVKEKLEEIGIPVLVERSSYESDPLGRLEWIKLYGLLYGKEDKANEVFKEQEARVLKIKDSGLTGKKVAFFSIASNGQVVVRKPGDYISTMIRMAGGEYVPSSLGSEDNALSTMKITLEDFYLQAKDADILIYNSTITGEVSSVNNLLSKAKVLSDFKAVKNDNVYCLEKDYFQKSSDVAEFIEDTHSILLGNDDDLTFIYKLEE